MDTLFALFIAYLIGSIPFGFILSMLFGHGDIRQIGSGNIGATNVLRTGNKALAALTLILDGGKGAVAVVILSLLFQAPAMLVGLFAILGHCFPVWLKFKGGKGVASTIGVLLAAAPWTGILVCVTWGIVAGFFYYSSLAALSALALSPVFTVIFYGPVPALVNVLISALVFWRHRENIQRLMKGTEPKIFQKQESENERE